MELLVRILHALNIYRNHYLSDKLHNNDKKYGDEYLNPEKIKIIQEHERKIHAEDWIAALGIIVSHHILFILVFLNPYKVDVIDISLLVIHIGIMYTNTINKQNINPTPIISIIIHFPNGPTP